METVEAVGREEEFLQFGDVFHVEHHFQRLGDRRRKTGESEPALGEFVREDVVVRRRELSFGDVDRAVRTRPAAAGERPREPPFFGSFEQRLVRLREEPAVRVIVVEPRVGGGCEQVVVGQ